MKYCVSRSIVHNEYVYVDAESEEDAISKAQTCDDDAWETNPNDEVFNEYDYNAEIEED